MFHNLYGIFSLTNKIELTIGFDIGTEEKMPNANSNNTWYAPVGIVRYSINDKWTIAARAEHYNDKNGVIVSTGTPNGFQTTGYSLNIDYCPTKAVAIRLEGKRLSSKDPVFTKGSDNVTKNTAVTISIATAF